MGAVSLLLSCAISIVGEINVSFFPFTSAAQEQKKKIIIIPENTVTGIKSLFLQALT